MIIDDYLDKLQEGVDFKLTREELAFARLLLISYGSEVANNKECKKECETLYEKELSNICQQM